MIINFDWLKYNNIINEKDEKDENDVSKFIRKQVVKECDIQDLLNKISKKFSDSYLCYYYCMNILEAAGDCDKCIKINGDVNTKFSMYIYGSLEVTGNVVLKEDLCCQSLKVNGNLSVGNYLFVDDSINVEGKIKANSIFSKGAIVSGNNIISDGDIISECSSIRSKKGKIHADNNIISKGVLSYKEISSRGNIESIHCNIESKTGGVIAKGYIRCNKIIALDDIESCRYILVDDYIETKGRVLAEYGLCVGYKHKPSSCNGYCMCKELPDQLFCGIWKKS